MSAAFTNDSVSRSHHHELLVRFDEQQEGIGSNVDASRVSLRAALQMSIDYTAR